MELLYSLRMLVRRLPSSILVASVVFSPSLAQENRYPSRGPVLLAQADSAVLRAYDSSVSDSNALEKYLKEEYAKRTDVQIVLDKRTNRFLVNAPESEQTKIRQKILDYRPPRKPQSPQNPAANQRPQQTGKALPTFEGQYQLRVISWQQLLKSIQGISQQRLALRQLQNAADLEVSVPSKKGTANFKLNPRNGLVRISGGKELVEGWVKTIQSLDQPAEGNLPQNARLVPLQKATPANVTRTVYLLQAALREQEDPDLRRAGGPQDLQNGNEAPADNNGVQAVAVEGGFIGQIQVEFVEGLDAIILKGRGQDIERMMKVIEELEKVSAETEPEIKLIDMKHVSSEAMASLVIELNEEVLSARQGPVSITPLIKPNSLLIIGRPDAVKETLELIEKLDQPVEPASQFKIYKLKHMPAESARVTIENFFTDRGGLAPQIQIQSDFRTNSVIVYASPRDMEEVKYLLNLIDIAESDSYSEVRVFQLRNASAVELSQLLQQTLRGDTSSQTGTTGPQQQQPVQQRPGAPPIQANQGTGNTTGSAGATSGLRSSMLQMKTLDAEGKQILQSGILTDVRVSADVRTNSLVITAPKESMDLISALVEQLDRLPSAEAQVDVFTIRNGSAILLYNTLTQLFGTGAQPQQNLQTALSELIGGEESSLVPLRFAVDERSNSIIATGSTADLIVVESILTRLDGSDSSQREYQVVRLLNAPAQDVEAAILNFLNQERQIVQPSAISQFIEREVVVVAELVSNSLVVSATPRYFGKIMDLIRELDSRPPMVMVQVLIAEVTLDNAEEIGVELGLQDSLLFDRSDAGVPGFLFNNQQLGNSTSDNSLRTREKTAGQALSSFALGRSNPLLGYGGLVLSASSESISVLIRALQETGRLDVLSRPQIMTLNNQPASILVGQEVPLLGGTVVNNVAAQSNIVREDVGLLLGVTPRISPDGLVVMEIDATRSSLGPEEDGVPVSVNENGDTIRQPIIDVTQARTTVSARTGQTIILGGLITKDRAIRTRRVPVIADVPILGGLFRYDLEVMERTELLFIMTPHIIKKDEDVDWINQVESQRMSWCLADVVQMHGETGMSSRCGPYEGYSTEVIYPYSHETPLMDSPHETLPNIEMTPDPAEVKGVPSEPGPDQTPRLNSPSLPPDAGVMRNSKDRSPQVNVAKWQSIQERQGVVSDDGIPEIKLNPPEPAKIKKQEKPSPISSIWSRIRGRRVESDDAKANRKASFLSPIRFTKSKSN